MTNTISRRLVLLGAGAAGISGTSVALAPRASAAEPPGVRLFGLGMAPLYRGGRYNYPAAVRAAQYLLRSHTRGLAADGSFGRLTEAAVVRLQVAHRLPRTGRIATGHDWLALFDQQVRYGSSGDAVRALQVRLDITVDGSFGPATHRAVVALQRYAMEFASGVIPRASGIVGQRTWTYLFAAVG